MTQPSLTFHTDSSIDTLSLYDAVLVIYGDGSTLQNSNFSSYSYATELINYIQLDPQAKLTNQPFLLTSKKAPGNKIFAVSVGKLDGDCDDVRKYFDAAEALTKRALQSGVRRPYIILTAKPEFEDVEDLYKNYFAVTLLGIFSASYVTLVAREYHESVKSTEKIKSLEQVGVFIDTEIHEQFVDKVKVEDFSNRVQAIEAGIRLTKDLANGNQERFTPLKFAKHVQDTFSPYPNVKVTVHSDITYLKENFPLLAAVARASLVVERHHPCVVELEYRSSDQSKVKENLSFVGKGVTFDTGGADLKVGGAMRGMSHDKGGAASVAGFLLSTAKLNPTNVNVTGYLAMVRNSIGADSYLCDEIILSRAGRRVLIGNTDAEGRMAMCDVLTLAKERAIAQHQAGDKAPTTLFTVATLTGHAVIAHGPYCIAMENGLARRNKVANRLVTAGQAWADPYEISHLRREDFSAVAPGSDMEDVIQANSKPSTQTVRGHQFPMAFMIVASGLNDCGLDSKLPIAYTHLDIAGGADLNPIGNGIYRSSGKPLASLVAAFLE